MVVSGVPQTNGDRHAAEVASMAWQIVAACLTFQIPHLPGEALQIRVGIHTGQLETSAQ